MHLDAGAFKFFRGESYVGGIGKSLKAVGLAASRKGRLVKNRVSNNVGGVKRFRAHYSVHSKKSAISLSLKMC
jgi:hypothetical protein